VASNIGLAAQVTGGAAIGLAAVTIGTNDFADVLFTTRSVEAMGMVLEQASSISPQSSISCSASIHRSISRSLLRSIFSPHPSFEGHSKWA